MIALDDNLDRGSLATWTFRVESTRIIFTPQEGSLDFLKRKKLVESRNENTLDE